MYLTRLLYVSDYNRDKPFDAGQMLKSAIAKNRANQITGALWFDGRQFIQVLEGARDVVSETYHRIAQDERHNNIELVCCNSVTERFFPQWSMGYFGDTLSNQQMILRYSTSDKLNPNEMSPDSLLGLMMTLELKNME